MRISISLRCSSQVCSFSIQHHLVTLAQHYLPYLSIRITQQSFELPGVNLEVISHDLCNYRASSTPLSLRANNHRPNSSSQCLITAKAATRPFAVWVSSNFPASALTVVTTTWELLQTASAITVKVFLRSLAIFHCAQCP
jgi:hypothetical protein